MRNNIYADNPFVIYRRRAGLRQCDTAEALNVGRSAVARWETGRAMPKASTLLAMAALYKCTTDELLGRCTEAQ